VLSGISDISVVVVVVCSKEGRGYVDFTRERNGYHRSVLERPAKSIYGAGSVYRFLCAATNVLAMNAGTYQQ
jgi:hypothetical protein